MSEEEVKLGSYEMSSPTNKENNFTCTYDFVYLTVCTVLSANFLGKSCVLMRPSSSINTVPKQQDPPQH